jgi:cytochrome c nitrite reductase small subunit
MTEGQAMNYDHQEDNAHVDKEAEEVKGLSQPEKRRYRLYSSIAFAVLLGILAGIGTFTFGYGKGASYLSNNPNSCANCHVMHDHFDSWQKSSHHHIATCNDCHMPHDFFGKWWTKADNGFCHSLAFTLQDYHDPIQIKPRNRRITQNACIDCHKDFVHALLPAANSAGDQENNDILSCVHCHADVGHAFRPFSSGSKRE